MPRFKFEKINGIVALAYLILIPAGAFYVWKKVEAIDNDVTTMWEKLEMPATKAAPIFDLMGAIEGFRRSMPKR